VNKNGSPWEHLSCNGGRGRISEKISCREGEKSFRKLLYISILQRLSHFQKRKDPESKYFGKTGGRLGKPIGGERYSSKGDQTLGKGASGDDGGRNEL